MRQAMRPTYPPRQERMMIRHNILFATDLADRDMSAFEIASELAMKAKSRLIVTHVVDPNNSSSTQLEMAKRKLAAYVPEDISVDFEHLLKQGDACECILQSVREKDIDLLILGTHGRDGLERAFFGSVAEKIIRKSSVPVMTIREARPSFPSHENPKLLVPIDFSVYGYAALEYATKLAISTGGEITIVHVDDSDHSATKQFPHGQPGSTDRQKQIWHQLKGYAPSSSKISHTHKLLKGDPAREIIEYANAKHFDFVVQGTHGRSGIRRAIMGSVAENIVRHVNCPVISIRPEEQQSISRSA